MHIDWLKKESIMLKNFDSVIVNMSPFLFESPHLEEVNYFSSTHQSQEKVFLLVLSMFVSNVDLSTDPNIFCFVYPELGVPNFTRTPFETNMDQVKFTSTAYKCTKEELLDTFKLLFEGQTRKFSALNFMI
jgi:hypothetical protein